MVDKVKKIYKKYEEVINYIIAGGCTTVVSLVSKYLLLFTVLKASDPIQLQIAVLISWVCAVTFAYITNRLFVFKSKSKSYLEEIAKFFGGRVGTLLMEMVIMWFFCNLLGLNSDMWVFVFTIVCQILIMIANYFISKFFVFSKKESK